MLIIKSKIKLIEEVSVQEHNLTRINSIKDKYKAIRQKSKAPTFA